MVEEYERKWGSKKLTILCKEFYDQIADTHKIVVTGDFTKQRLTIMPTATPLKGWRVSSSHTSIAGDVVGNFYTDRIKAKNAVLNYFAKISPNEDCLIENGIVVPPKKKTRGRKRKVTNDSPKEVSNKTK